MRFRCAVQSYITDTNIISSSRVFFLQKKHINCKGNRNLFPNLPPFVCVCSLCPGKLRSFFTIIVLWFFTFSNDLETGIISIVLN